MFWSVSGFLVKWHLRNNNRNSTLVTCHYPDLLWTGWSKLPFSLAAQPIRSTTQIWVVTHHQYGISPLFFSDIILQENQWWCPEMSAITAANVLVIHTCKVWVGDLYGHLHLQAKGYTEPLWRPTQVICKILLICYNLNG